MSDVAIAWFRRDLRVDDLPMLAEAAERHPRVAPVFVFDPRLLRTGRFPSAPRTAFMLGCLEHLDAALRERGGALIVRHGRPEDVIPALAAELRATRVYCSEDVSPWSRDRDRRVERRLAAAGVQMLALEGSQITDVTAIRTKQGQPYTVFGAFARAWRAAPRRAVREAPTRVRLPDGVDPGVLPTASELGVPDPGALAFEPGEPAGRRATRRFFERGIDTYGEGRRTPASDGSSRLSPYVRWGCVSPLAIDEAAASRGTDGAEAFRTELAWRDYYAAVLIHFPSVTRLEHDERLRALEWDHDDERFKAWAAGRTGYPFVDAGMRQLAAEHWMHNRLRMVVGSFLIKDLHLDWRLGEAHFMYELLDGDMAANNGGWQWVASTGVDRAPYFQRMFNPITQAERFDPDGHYVRRWVPELRDVPQHRILRPWEMSDAEQRAAGCVIGRDYPAPIVDHAAERRVAMERYRRATEGEAPASVPAAPEAGRLVNAEQPPHGRLF